MASQQQSPFHRTVNLDTGVAPSIAPLSPSGTAGGSDSVKEYIAKLKQQLADAYEQLKEYKKQSELYRGEIEQMRHVLEAVNQDNMSHIVPRLQLISDTYNQAIANQKQENTHLQQRLTDLKKDKSQMQQQIDDYERRLEHMLQNIGL